jgi:hypothetical protein
MATSLEEEAHAAHPAAREEVDLNLANILASLSSFDREATTAPSAPASNSVPDHLFEDDAVSTSSSDSPETSLAIRALTRFAAYAQAVPPPEDDDAVLASLLSDIDIAPSTPGPFTSSTTDNDASTMSFIEQMRSDPTRRNSMDSPPHYTISSPSTSPSPPPADDDNEPDAELQSMAVQVAPLFRESNPDIYAERLVDHSLREPSSPRVSFSGLVGPPPEEFRIPFVARAYDENPNLYQTDSLQEPYLAYDLLSPSECAIP